MFLFFFFFFIKFHKSLAGFPRHRRAPRPGYRKLRFRRHVLYLNAELEEICIYAIRIEAARQTRGALASTFLFWLCVPTIVSSYGQFRCRFGSESSGFHTELGGSTFKFKERTPEGKVCPTPRSPRKSFYMESPSLFFASRAAKSKRALARRPRNTATGDQCVPVGPGSYSTVFHSRRMSKGSPVALLAI